MERRNQVFQQLKPLCVQLSQDVLRVAGNTGNNRDVVKSLSELLNVLSAITAQDKQALDAKLAEYVFFPLSHVLREKQKLSLRALELTLRCMTLLLQTGWRSDVDPRLSRQLLILFPVLAGGNLANAANKDSSEELQAVALQCLSDLFLTYGNSLEGKKSLTEISNIPPLGHAVTVILDGISKGASFDVQYAAITALHACCSAISDRDALASFFPGIVSTLANVLTPSTKLRRSYKVLYQALDILCELFRKVVGDEATRNLPESVETTDESNQPQKLTAAWLKATAAQVKLAMANIIRIRQHERKEVRQSLLSLCLVVLEDCRSSLQDSAAMMIETMTVLCGTDENDEIRHTIQHVLTADQRVAELLRSSLRTWTVSLPRLMQSPDDAAKRKVIEQIDTGYQLLSGQGVDLTIIDRAIAVNLRDSIAGAMIEKTKVGDLGSPAASLDLTAPNDSGRAVTFGPVLSGHQSQQDTISDLHQLVLHVGTSSSSLNATRDLVDSLYSSKGASQIAAFWTSLNLLKSSTEHNSVVDDFLDLGDTGSNVREELLEELYSFSLDVLQGPETESQQDWRLQALALETIAFQAQTLKADFSIELVEALYPVVHLVGSPIPELRNHANVSLNIIASQCGFDSVSNLIVSNVDYLVNAVGLKLNTFDISPQVPQVLLMMVKLTGPSLLPYLDDLVGSIFSALECFHGYPKLVELLFAVLKGIAEEGAKAPQLAITDGDDTPRGRNEVRQLSTADVAELLRQMKRKEAERAEADAKEDAEQPFPRKPWKEEKEKKENENDNDPSIDPDDPSNADPTSDQEGEEEEAPQDPPPPLPKTYALLLKISTLTQHHLPSSSAPLRTSLLSLLLTTIPALAKHESSFLPLINTLWPALASRLDDNEAYVLADTMDVVAAMCVYAGDFMRGRVESVWGRLRGLWWGGGRAGERPSSSAPRKTAKQMIEGAASAPGTTSTATNTATATATPYDGTTHDRGLQGYYIDAPTRIIRAHLIKLLVVIVRHLNIEEDAFEEVLEMLLPIVESQDEVREVLERRNPDAVWLALARARARAGQLDVGRETPKAVGGREFVGVVG